jgi:hypothetical protein
VNLADDPRWRRFNDRAFQCPCCGKSFNGVFDIHYDHPDPWPHGKYRDNGGQDVKVGTDVLGSDICIAQDAYFVRGLVEIPIIGTETRFAFGVWSTLKKENFAAYLDAYGTDDELKIGPYFGWLCNDLPNYGIRGAMKSEVSFRGGGIRPSFHVWDERSSLGHDQHAGITFDQLLDLYAACGSDIRPHLMDG